MAITEENIAFGNIANALKSVADDHILGVASDIYDAEWKDYQDKINKTLKEKLTSVENIPTLINGGVVNLSSTGDVESVYESLKDNGVAICIIGDSNGNYPSITESRINVNSKYCDAANYFFSADDRGASVGDLLLVSKQKYSISALNIIVQVCALKIIPINDAKVAIDGKYGVEGIVTVGDKERINKIDGIEWTANNVRDNYLPKSDFLPSLSGSNMNECLETGVYVGCTTGRPEGSDGAYTCITIKSSTPDGDGFYTHNQICLGRSGANNGQMYQRLVFTNPTTGAIEVGYTWKRIDNVDTKVIQTEVNNEYGEYPLLLSPSSGHTSGNAGEAYYDTEVTLDPSTNTLTVGTVVGNLIGEASTAAVATTAKKLSGGSKGSIPYQSSIDTTVFLDAGDEGQVLKMGAKLPFWGDDNNTDTKVNQTKVDYDVSYPLLLSPLNSQSQTPVAGEAYYDAEVTLNPSTNTLTVGIVVGNLIGEASTAKSLSGGGKGYIPYQDAANSTKFLTAGTNGYVLKMGSNGLPAWLPETGGGTDTKVNQTAKYDNVEYPLLLSSQTIDSSGEAYYDDGVTLNPSTDTLTTKLKLKTTAGQWKDGLTKASIDYKLSKDEGIEEVGIGYMSYHPIFGMKSGGTGKDEDGELIGGGNVVNIGGYQDYFGFYGWSKADITAAAGANITPTWRFIFDTATGNVTASGVVVATSFKEGDKSLSDKYVSKANMTDATTAEIEALFN